MRQRHFKLACYLGFMRSATQLAFKAMNRIFYIPLTLARRARQPVIGAQLIEHRSANTLRGVNLELRTLRHFESRYRVHQPHHAGLDHVVELNVGGQPSDHLMSKSTYQRCVLLDIVAIEQGTGAHLLQWLASTWPLLSA